MSERTLRVLRRRRDIACVLVNPLQALHPNQAAPADSSLVDSGRHAGFDRQAYTGLVAAAARVCDERGIVLIFDEVFVGFRLAPGGAKEYFGVQPDLITYGKSLGGGLPVGVLCGRSALMKRYRDGSSGRCLLRARHVQLASLRHGGDVRVPAPPRIPGNPGSVSGPGPRLERPRRAAERSPACGGSAGQGREPLVDLDRLLHACRHATTGCCNTIFAPRGLR